MLKVNQVTRQATIAVMARHAARHQQTVQREISHFEAIVIEREE